MKVARGRVLKGVVVTRARLPEGARVIVLAQEQGGPVQLTPEEEANVAAGIADIEAGRIVSGDVVRSRLQRRRLDPPQGSGFRTQRSDLPVTVPASTGR